MELIQNPQDIQDLGNEYQDFTPEEIEEAFRRTKEEIKETYFETLAYFLRSIKRKRKPPCTCSTLLKFLQDRRLHAGNSTVDYVLHITSEKICFRLPSLDKDLSTQTVNELIGQLEMYVDSDPVVFVENSQKEIVPLDLDSIKFMVPCGPLRMVFDDDAEQKPHI